MVPTELRLRRSIVVAAGLSALVAAGVAVTRVAPELSLPRSPGQPTAAAPGERVVVGPLQNRSGAWLTVGDAAARVRLRFAPLPGLLYRISTASDAGVAPVVTSRGGRVVVRLKGTGSPGLDELRIVLNQNVRWDLRLPKGAGEQQLNLRDGRVTRLDVGSAGLAEVWLPEPDGTVPVTFTGGIGTAMLSLRDGAPVQVRFAEGAGSVAAPWTTNNGTAAGTVLREPGFRRSRDRYVIRAEGGLGALVIRRSPKPDAEKPRAPKPDAEKPDPGSPDIGSPDPGGPDSGSPDIGNPGRGRPGRERAAAPKNDRPKADPPRADPQKADSQKAGAGKKTDAQKNAGPGKKVGPLKSESPKGGAGEPAPAKSREPTAPDGPRPPARTGPGVAGDPAAARKPGVRPVPGGPGRGSPGTVRSRTK
ncbi:hypothetical protein QLQ12_22980 [Actinoplanes sp. NEAU-A12]|uniref:Uncharacterized protein n=1 Tax=Actinoplanes sandaracinus TaxID=3045177 RepID=A0ABT6WP44_9ACTN|nr:hypothetical protein [Actinoplanes sandaracinus]MDI6101487.1 hypothetical protein [Actinoplanes sandaracinus]